MSETHIGSTHYDLPMSSVKPPTGSRHVPVTNWSRRVLCSCSNSRTNCNNSANLATPRNHNIIDCKYLHCYVITLIANSQFMVTTVTVFWKPGTRLILLIINWDSYAMTNHQLTLPVSVMNFLYKCSNQV